MAVIQRLMEEAGWNLEQAMRFFDQSYLPGAYADCPEESLHEDPAYLARKVLQDYNVHTLTR